ncbi:MAG: chorismate--pyruvate lyase [Dorea sp.]|nr:chorismate--pyruvate lyase [Dorea sp.]
MLTCTYIVERIDGDYAMLRREDEVDADAEPKMVARALLPPEIMEGTRLLYEYLQYSILD